MGNLKQISGNPREFLFDKVFGIFGYGDFTVNVVDNIEATKAEYDGAVRSLIDYLNGAVKTLFADGKPNGGLTSTVKDWYEALSERTRQYLFAGNESRILELMAMVTNDENSFIQRLAKAVTYLRIDDWNNDTVDVFLRDLETFKNTVEDFNNQKVENEQNTTSYEIIITDANGKRQPRRFDKAKYSEKAILLRNEISTALEEMGQAITEQEKRQVLIELLEKLC